MTKEKKEEGKFSQNKYGVFGEPILTPIGRAAFLNLINPSTIGPVPKYGLTILFDKSDNIVKDQLKKMQEMCIKMGLQFFKDEAGYRAAKEKFKYAMFRDGDEKTEYNGFAGNYYIRANNKSRSKIIITDGKSGEEFEAGMKVRGQVQPFLGVDGFSYILTGLRLVADDNVRFAAGPPGDSLLADLDDAVQAVSAESSGLGSL